MDQYSEIDEQIPFEEIKLTDLIESKTLQKIQDSFSKMVRMAALTTDADGVPITRGSNFSRFCTDFCRKSEIGHKRCEQCDINGAMMALKKGGPISYYCHADLVDFAAPIMIRGKVIGSFIGGQVLPKPPNLERMAKIAEEIHVDKDEFLRAARETNIVPKSAINRATEFIYSFSQILSDIAYQAYTAKYFYKKASQAATAKSDFLANMSHEIRTPMNAVLGMANIALRENLPKNARESVKQIVSSGKLLLTIINDILDFSKIEAGKLEIIEEPYEPFLLVNDLSSFFATKIGEKDLEFIVDATPNLPREIFGDSVRIKQVITNLANNAIKFTNEGQVCLHIDFDKMDMKDEYGNEIVNLKCCVEDTGIGIKDEDKEKLFTSFQQVDTKRNRNVEGTGLGLAISKNLVELMGGEISFESEYGKGSKFFFEIPQIVKNTEPCFKIECNENFCCGILTENKYVKIQLKKDFENLGVEYHELDVVDCLEEIKTKRINYLFVSQPFFSDKIKSYTKEHRELIVVLIASLNSEASCSMSNIRVLRKPLYVLSVASVLKNISMDVLLGESRKEDFYFTAPKANVLIVDDNDVNIIVAKGLLKPLKLKVDYALSGKECLDKVHKKKYDLIFMDHMMPMMDGVETTILIRRDYPEYKDVPIIALTANVLAETRNMFLHSGMNDFVPKPIELRVIVPKIKKWLPAEKIIQSTEEEIAVVEKNLNANEGIPKIDIEGLDTEYSLSLLGTEKLFWEVLKGWYKAIEKKIGLIQQYKNDCEWKSYTIEVHALKSSSRQIGALELSKMAEDLEVAGHAGNITMINEKTDEMLDAARAYIPILAPYFTLQKENDEGKEEASEKFISEKLVLLDEAVDNLDIMTAEEITKEMECYRFFGKEKDLFQKLLDAVEDMDMESCMNIVSEWKDLLASGRSESAVREKVGSLLKHCLLYIKNCA